MSDDTLRLVAKLDDQVTGPLGKVEGALKRTSNQGRDGAAAMRKEWEGFRAVLGTTNTAISGMAAPLSALGLAGGGAALSLAAAGSALRDFSKSTQSLEILSKQTGLTVESLRALENMGGRVGIAGTTMLSAADNFSRAAAQLKRGYSEAIQSLPNMNLRWLLDDLRSAKSAEEMMNKLFEGLPKISNIEARRRVLTMFFGTEDIDRIIQEYGNDAAKKLQEIRGQVGTIGPEAQKAAREFEDMVGRWDAALGKAKIWALTPLLEGAVKTMGGIADAAEKLRSGHPLDALKALDQATDLGFGSIGKAPAAVSREKLEGRRSQVQRQLELLEAGPRSSEYQRKHDRMVDELKRVADELQKLREQGGASVSPSSFDGSDGVKSLIQKAAYGGSPFVGGGYGGSSGSVFGRGGTSRASRSSDAPENGGGFQGIPFGSSSAGATGGQTTANTPRGTGRGNSRAARTGDMMAYAMDQLRREGVPEANLRQAAAHLVGQATMESGLDPNKTHDGGTGYGIYGARDPKGWGDYKGARRSHMVKWLEKNGYARNSAEGQMRYMAHEAMSGSYPNTKRILMSGGGAEHTNTITREFEGPAVINHRAGAVQNAMRVGPTQQGPTASGDDGGFFPNGAPRVLKPKSMAGDKSVPGHVMGDGFEQTKPWSTDPGASLMKRFYGSGTPSGGAPTAGSDASGGQGTLHIKLEGASPGTRISHDMDGLFRGVTVSRHRSSEMSNL
ncbi:phage tail tip lysozyme [Methylobacterium gnaphalii]|uniref:Phage tail lysozyme domain-containing protein n=1 Tax=Methylobacterium gnaphalii TaxID=1010610 RepID=A0A512JF64_9HYPH|nr:phage tail tip lysozyme [Methylobacterium gnaphalii]GEP08585.1 hypothetical protein MGN01_04300 [Methylobacterium gnaphalii]GJD70580.1 hypothetical protein MMMDOFMJ_3529 [Methylobacterium gnaphalii]GLS50802.1 hypothetical protein GCM10007885_36560 [Methylobacterium gnaphalii]